MTYILLKQTNKAIWILLICTTFGFNFQWSIARSPVIFGDILCIDEMRTTIGGHCHLKGTYGIQRHYLLQWDVSVSKEVFLASKQIIPFEIPVQHFMVLIN
jgi:hypothetical protein